MPRRLLALAVAALVLVVSTGCASDVSPAAVIDGRKISNDDFMAEVAEWAGSPTLIKNLQLESPQGSGPGSYSTAFTDIVMSIRIGFELQNAKFDELGLTLTDQQVSDVRSAIFQDPADTEALFTELGETYGDRLAADVARQFAVQDALGADYQAWLAGAYADTKVEVNPRYGTWDAETGQVVAPDGPVNRSTTTTAFTGP